MHARPIVRIMILILVVSVVTLSCSFDYWLDFALTDITHTNPSEKVDVGYSMINNGGRSMHNASIRIQVTANLMTGMPEQHTEWLPIVGVDLASYGGKYSDTYSFSFSGLIDGTTIEVEIIGARWDEQTSGY